MNNLRNSVQLIGHLGTNPEIIQLENGNKLSKFSLATTYTYTTQNGERVSDTQWHNVVAWGKLAELCEKYVTKGDLLTLEGRIAYRNYEDKDGNKRYITEIIMNDMVLPKRPKEEEAVMPF